jgi:predicted O-methyltransferase YrrM
MDKNMNYQNALKVRNAFDYLTEPEMAAMAGICKEMSKATVINIGAGAGTSGLLFLECLPEGRVYTIDVTNESSPFGCLQGERVVVEEAGLRHRHGLSWFQIHGDSKKVGLTWIGVPVDILFIDGDHSLGGCLGDMAAWIPHVVKGGVILVHDYNKQNMPNYETRKIKYEGVNDAVDLYLFRNYEKVSVIDTLAIAKK